MPLEVNRRVMSFVLLLLAPSVAPAFAQQPQRAGLTPFQRAKAEALLDAKLPCLGCHALNGTGGKIGPDLSDVGVRLGAGRIRAQVLQPVGIMPRIHLPPSTLDLIVSYLAEQRGSPDAQRPTVPAAARGSSEAERLYNVHCAACHGVEGNGDGWNGRYLDRPPARHSDARAMSARADDRLFDGIYAGGAILGGSARMPPFGGSLTPAEIRLLVGYIRELCRCRQPSWADAPR